MPNLVIVPAGDDSLHPEYATDRNYDLWVLYWGSNEEKQREYEATADRVIARQGLKFELLRFATDQLYAARARWDGGYILYIDDDIRFACGSKDIETFFSVAMDLRADVAQPAIGSGHFSWRVTGAIDGCFAHATDFAESMMAAYSSDVFFKIVLPGLFALPHLRVAWCYEFYICRHIDCYFQRGPRIFVVDSVPACHTRPQGHGSSPKAVGNDEVFLMPGLSAYAPKTLKEFPDKAAAMAYRFPRVEPCDEGLAERLADVRRARLAVAAKLDVSKPATLVTRGLRELIRRARGRQHRW